MTSLLDGCGGGVVTLGVEQLGAVATMRIDHVSPQQGRGRIEEVVAQHTAAGRALGMCAGLVQVGTAPPARPIRLSWCQFDGKLIQLERVKDARLRRNRCVEMDGKLRIRLAELVYGHGILSRRRYAFTASPPDGGWD